ncbi:MAG: putative DNA binding domain-containing protein [Lachnospiraceae bacterium]|jgi:predicted HTH transcriptional regulator|nr:putative DNA binding domain-containing protein [Lachnospiraceae bacterium]
MLSEKLNKARAVGENVCTEFKRAGGKIEDDTYETVCAFLNRFGGDIYLGVLDDGTIAGVPEKAAGDMVKNFINMVSNPDVMNPTIYLEPKVLAVEGKMVIHIRVPTSPEVHNYKKVVYDRLGDADDRLIVQTNLIESYGLLMGFAEKHLPDKFYLEDDARVSLRNAISREMLVNTLMHREFTSSYTAKFVIERDRMYTENANRAANDDPVTPDDFEPNTKNPLIAAFFRNIGMADELGSGVRKMFKYGRRYSGKDPQLIEGDVFRTIVPLDDNYSFEAAVGETKPQNPKTSKPQSPKTSKPQNGKKLALIEALIIECIKTNPHTTQKAIIEASGKSKRSIQEGFADLQAKGVLVREGSKQKPTWVVKGE